MTKINFLKIAILALSFLFYAQVAFSCSMYKITANGKTVVGNNEDSWGRDAQIWFEQGTDEKYGIACVGYARKQPNPDGATNEHGLVFDAFTMPHKANSASRDPHKKDFGYPQIRTIMQQCKTFDEVYAFLEKLNLFVLNGSPIFNGGMLLFADKTGKYLAVESDKMTFGNDDKFALANFSFANTKDLSTIKTERYCKGVAFLNNKKLETNLAYCTALSDTMSVNRAKVGNGTLYTSIYNLEEGLIHLYFYHDFSKRVTFNLKEELAQGNQTYNMAALFPANENYHEFLAYKTPQSSKVIFFFMVACGLLFFFSTVFFLMSFFKSSTKDYAYLKLGLSVFSLALLVYVYVLLRNEGVFYFPSPYNDGHSLLVAATLYLPFILLFVIIPLLLAVVKIFKQKIWRGIVKWVLLANSAAYVMLIGLFAYWRLFDIFN